MPASFATTTSCIGHLVFRGRGASETAAGEQHGVSNERVPVGSLQEALTAGWRIHEAKEERGQHGSSRTVKVGADD